MQNEAFLKLKIFDEDDKLNPLIEERIQNNTLIQVDFYMELKEKIFKHFEGKVVRNDFNRFIGKGNAVLYQHMYWNIF